MAERLISLKRKKELQEPDEFITISSRILQYVMIHRTAALLVVLGIVMLGASLFGLRMMGQKADRESFEALHKANAAYMEAAKTQDDQKAFSEVKDDFEALFSRYGNRSGGRMGKIAFGNICLKAGQWDKAISLFTEVLSGYDDTAMRNFILSGLGYAFEGKKDWTSAIRYFSMIESGENPHLKADACFHLGFLHAEAGNPEKSREFYEKIVKDYKDSLFVDLAKDRISG